MKEMKEIKKYSVINYICKTKTVFDSTMYSKHSLTTKAQLHKHKSLFTLIFCKKSNMTLVTTTYSSSKLSHHKSPVESNLLSSDKCHLSRFGFSPRRLHPVIIALQHCSQIKQITRSCEIIINFTASKVTCLVIHLPCPS